MVPAMGYGERIDKVMGGMSRLLHLRSAKVNTICVAPSNSFAASFSVKVSELPINAASLIKS